MQPERPVFPAIARLFVAAERGEEGVVNLRPALITPPPMLAALLTAMGIPCFSAEYNDLSDHPITAKNRSRAASTSGRCWCSLMAMVRPDGVMMVHR